MKPTIGGGPIGGSSNRKQGLDQRMGTGHPSTLLSSSSFVNPAFQPRLWSARPRALGVCAFKSSFARAWRSSSLSSRPPVLSLLYRFRWKGLDLSPTTTCRSMASSQGKLGGALPVRRTRRWKGGMSRRELLSMPSMPGHVLIHPLPSTAVGVAETAATFPPSLFPKQLVSSSRELKGLGAYLRFLRRLYTLIWTRLWPVLQHLVGERLHSDATV